MHTKAWRTELMGSEGWAVFIPNPKLPRFEIMIASNLSEEHARLIAAALELLEALEKVAEWRIVDSVYCYICGNHKDRGHRPHCYATAVDKAIHKARGE